MGVGRTSTVYTYGTGAVVKVPFAEVPTHWAELEARSTAAVRTMGLPVPEVLGMVEIDDRPAIVFEHIDGVSLLQQMIDDPSSTETFAREFADVHRRIQRAGIPADVPDLVDRLCLKTQTVRQLTDEERAEACDTAMRLPRGAALLHGDFHPGNVLMSRSGPIVIDWFDATVGHPVADVVRSSILLSPPPKGIESLHLPGLPRPMMETVRSIYLETFSALLENAGDLLPSWRAVSAASRLSEGAEVDESELLAIWKERPQHVDLRVERLPGVESTYESM